MVVVWLLLGAGPVLAAGRLDSVRFGRQLYGPELRTEQFKGHVVALLIWTTEGSASGRALARFARLQKQYGRYGLVTVAVHVDVEDKPPATASAVCYIAHHNGACFPVVHGINALSEADRKLPYVQLYDHTGSEVFVGGVEAAASAVKRAILRAPDPIFAGKKFSKLAPQVRALRSRRNLGLLLKQLQKLQQADDEQLAEQAAQLSKCISDYAERLLREAEQAERDAPSECIGKYERIASLFAGSSYAQKAAEKIKQLRSSEQFKKQLQADQAYQRMVEAAYSIPPRPSYPSQQRTWARRNAAKFRRVYQMLQEIQRRWPDTTAAERAQQFWLSLDKPS